jgi:hypothetical protein
MLSKRTIAIAMALTIGLASAALAARGSRVLANGEAASGGVNPAEHRNLAAPKEPEIMSEGKCFMNTSNGNYEWADCRRH